MGRTTSRSTHVQGAANPAIAPSTIPLREHAQEALQTYFASLNGHQPSGLHQLVIREVEGPLFQAVMAYTQGNQVRAAEILGINRGTLRRKLEDYGLVE